MIARSGRHTAENLGLAIGDRPARQYRDPAIDIAPCRHAGSPIAALDDAGGEVDRVCHRLEMEIAPGALVPFGLELFQRLNEVVCRGDGVRAGACLEHMYRETPHLQAKPDDTNLRAYHFAGCRLGNETGVGTVAAL